MEVGQPARRRASAGDRGGAGRARQERARLHRVARHSVAARAHRAALRARPIGVAGRRRAHHRDHRLVGRFHPGVPVDVRAGRPGRHRQSRLSAVSPHPHRARLRAGADRDRRRRRAWRITGESLRAAHRAEAARRRAGREPGQSDRHHDDAGGAGRPDPRRRRTRASASSPTRSITGSTMPCRPRPRRGCRTTPSSSIRSRNTSA